MAAYTTDQLEAMEPFHPVYYGPDPSYDKNYVTFGGPKGSNTFEGTKDTSEDFAVTQYLSDLLRAHGAEQTANRMYNSTEAQKQRDWASAENQANRDWQTSMANSSYTRAVEDLKNAGLNPILALSSGFGGAQTGNTSLSAGSSASYNVNNADTASDLISSILNGLGNSLTGVSNLIGSIFGKKTTSTSTIYKRK